MCPSNYSRFNVIIDYVFIWYARKQPDPRSKLLKQGQLKQCLNQPSIYCFKKSSHRLRIKEIIKWRSFCRILKRLNVINVNSEYCVKRVNFLFCLEFIHYKDVLFKNNDLRSSDVKKPQF